MADLRKVQSGQRFRPQAETWNAFVDAARYVQERTLGLQAEADRLDPRTIVVRNTSPVLVPRYGLLWVLGPAFDGLALAARPGHPFLAQLAIAAEPIAAGAVGRAWNEGQHPLRIRNWSGLKSGDFPLLAISQADAFEARAWTGTGTLLVLGKLQQSPLVLADLTARSAS